MNILRAVDYRRMPWKNGGGETAEIVAFPPGSSVAQFDWRLSMATVATAGPFSRFHGVDRTLTVIDGGAMTLHIEGQPACRLDRYASPLFFSGDLATEASLEGGTVIDFNVMTQRATHTHAVRRMSIRGPELLTTSAAITCLFCVHGKILLRPEAGVGKEQRLDTHDLAMFTPDHGAVLISSSATADALWVAIAPVTHP